MFREGGRRQAHRSLAVGAASSGTRCARRSTWRRCAAMTDPSPPSVPVPEPVGSAAAPRSHPRSGQPVLAAGVSTQPRASATTHGGQAGLGEDGALRRARRRSRWPRSARRCSSSARAAGPPASSLAPPRAVVAASGLRDAVGHRPPLPRGDVPHGHDRHPRRQLLHGQRRRAAVREARPPGHAHPVLHRRVRGHRRPTTRRAATRAGASAPARPTSGTTSPTRSARPSTRSATSAIPTPRRSTPSTASTGRWPTSSATSRASACRPRPSGSSRRAAPTGASTPGATRIRAPVTSTRAARSASPGGEERHRGEARCTTSTTASPNTAPVGSFPKGGVALRRARTSSATSGSGSPTGTAPYSEGRAEGPQGPRDGRRARHPRRRVERRRTRRGSGRRSATRTRRPSAATASASAARSEADGVRREGAPCPTPTTSSARLDRVTREQTEFALGLYRDHEARRATSSIRFELPPSADRVAIAIDDGAKGAVRHRHARRALRHVPGQGDAPDTPVCPAPAGRRAAREGRRQAGAPRDARSARCGPTEDEDDVFQRIATRGSRLAREDFVAVSAFEPMLGARRDSMMVASSASRCSTSGPGRRNVKKAHGGLRQGARRGSTGSSGRSRT